MHTAGDVIQQSGSNEGFSSDLAKIDNTKQTLPTLDNIHHHGQSHETRYIYLRFI